MVGYIIGTVSFWYMVELYRRFINMDIMNIYFLILEIFKISFNG